MNQEVKPASLEEQKTPIVWRKELLALAALALPFIVLPIVWSRLPEQIPMHWNFSGEVDRYADLGFELLLFPFLSIGVYLILLLVHRIDPKRKGRTFGKPMPAYRFAVVVIMNGIFLATLATAMADIDDSTLLQLVGAAISLLFVVLGNFLSALQPNYFVGIRTPWTLESAEIWKATHRAAGRVWVAMGAVLLIFSIFLPWQEFRIPLFIGISIMVAHPVIYSLILYRRQVQ